jgi:WD40 repeat protein
LYRAEFSSDNQLVLTASGDGTAALWSVKTGERLQQFQHQGIVFRALFSPDGQQILTASADNNAALWSVLNLNISIEDAIQKLHLKQTCLTPEQREHFFLSQLTDAQWAERGCVQYQNSKLTVNNHL